MPTTLNLANLDDLIESMRHPREDEERSIDVVLLRKVTDLGENLQLGWPHQDTFFNAHEGPLGIPVQLADIVLEICHYCADHNIDLTDAIGLIYKWKTQ